MHRHNKYLFKGKFIASLDSDSPNMELSLKSSIARRWSTIKLCMFSENIILYNLWRINKLSPPLTLRNYLRPVTQESVQVIPPSSPRPADGRLVAIRGEAFAQQDNKKKYCFYNLVFFYALSHKTLFLSQIKINK